MLNYDLKRVTKDDPVGKTVIEFTVWDGIWQDVKQADGTTQKQYVRQTPMLRATYEFNGLLIDAEVEMKLKLNTKTLSEERNIAVVPNCSLTDVESTALSVKTAALRTETANVAKTITAVKTAI